MDRATRSKSGVRFPVLMLVVTGVTTAAAVLGAEPFVRGVMLGRSGQTVEAEVTRADAVRRGRRSANSRYVLEYRFRPPGDGRWYTHTDIISHDPCHVGVSHPVWEEARRSRRIAVSYVPSRPWINRPVDHVPLDGVAFPAFMAGFFALFAGATWVSFLDDVKTYRRARSASA